MLGGRIVALKSQHENGNPAIVELCDLLIELIREVAPDQLLDLVDVDKAEGESGPEPSE